MKFKELKIMNELDLEGKSAELKKELMKINSQIAIGTLPKSPGKIGEMKRTLARILTINNSRRKSAENNVTKIKGVEKRNG